MAASFLSKLHGTLSSMSTPCQPKPTDKNTVQYSAIHKNETKSDEAKLNDFKSANIQPLMVDTGSNWEKKQ